MDAPALLSPVDLHDLTGFRRPGKQRAALAAMGIPYYTRLDGRPVVVAANLARPTAAPVTPEPNWGAICPTKSQ